MIKQITSTITILFLILSVLFLFQIKYKVQNLIKDVHELERQLNHEKTSIHMLKAEWAHLNNPQRLKILVSKYSDLQELDPTQITNIKKDTYEPKKKSIRKNVRWSLKDKDLAIYLPGKRNPLISIRSN